MGKEAFGDELYSSDPPRFLIAVYRKTHEIAMVETDIFLSKQYKSDIYQPKNKETSKNQFLVFNLAIVQQKSSAAQLQ